ncbi:MAG: hypothetical protein LBQ46_03185 [Treponema sp.]|jgi:hypothetical protein|nr:hypothetical protein [Treponema sp.]
MIQFYFLSILLNALGGFLLFSNSEEGKGSAIEAEIHFSLQNETFRLILGVLCALMGLLKLLSPIEGDIPVIGDLVPAAAGLVSGFILLFDYYHGRSFFEEGDGRMRELITVNRRWIGFAVMAAAVLHFVFPRVLLL